MENFTSDDGMLEFFTSDVEMLDFPESIDELIENLRSNNFVKRDCGDYYELNPTGVVMMNNDKFTWVGDYYELNPTGVVMKNDKFTWVAGGDECDVMKADQQLISVPRLALTIPKNMPADMTVESLMEQIAEDLTIFIANWRRKEKAKKEKKYCGEKKPQGFGIVREQTGDAEAHKAMEELNSALDDCTKGSCAACVRAKL